MNIQLNGEPGQIRASLTVTELFSAESLAECRVAVEINGEIVPRSLHSTHLLREADRV